MLPKPRPALDDVFLGSGHKLKAPGGGLHLAGNENFFDNLEGSRNFFQTLGGP